MTYIGAKLLEALTTSSSSSGGGVTISDTSPSSPSAGDQWFNSSDLKMYIYYADGSSSQWVQSSPTGNITGTSLSSFSVGSEGSASGDGAIAYNNSSGVFTYTPPLIGGSTTVYANTSSLPSVASATTGDMAFVTANTRFYVFNGSAWYSVALTNTAPTVSGSSASYELATNGSATVVTLSSSDPEGDPLTFSHTTSGLVNEATIVQGTGSNTNVFTVTPSTTEAHAGSFTVTFSATDGANVVNNTSSFSLVFALPQSFSTGLLVKTSGNNNRTNSSIFDQSTSTHTISTYATQQTTFSPYLTNSSIEMGGSGDYLEFANSTQHDRSGVTNWTLEAWVWLDDYSTVNDASALWYSKYNYPSPAGGIFIGVDKSQGNKTFARVNSNNTQTMTGLYIFPLRQWVHVALVRNGNGSNNISLYQDGVLQMQITQATTVSNVTVPVSIGRRSSFYATNTWNGKIHTVRMNNTAIYTAEFTPPTANLTSTSDTAFLVGAGATNFNDQSTNAQVPTVYGTCKIEATGYPYKDFTIWKQADGGSAYFDGTNHYIVSAASSDYTLGTGDDFTVECWFYATAHTSGIYHSHTSALPSSNQGHGLGISNASKLLLYQNGSNQTVDSPTLILNQWYHVAITRASGSKKVFLNGALVKTISETEAYTGTYMTVGGYYSTSFLMNGYIADFNYIKGTAKYTSAFTVPTASITNHANTKLRLNFNQAGVFDATSKSDISLVGSGVKESNAQTKYATTNFRADVGNSKYGYITGLTPPRTGNFQVETWLWLDTNQTTATNSGAGIFRLFGTTAGNSSTHNGVSMMLLNNTLHINLDYGGSNFPSTGDTISRATWHHLAYTRQNGKIYIFLNGTEIYNVANTIDFTGTDGYLGTFYNYTAHCIDGYLEDFRYLNGHTTYPNEAPQEALTAVSGTTVQFANASSIPSTIGGANLTNSEGTPVASTFSPPYSTVAHSVEYSGSQCNYLAYSSNTHLGTGDFTIEFHYYIKEFQTTYMGFLNQRHPSDPSGNSGDTWSITYTSGRLDIFSNGGYIMGLPAPELQIWKHLVFQRKTISGTKTFQVFMNGSLVAELADSGNKNFPNVGLTFGGGYSENAENGSFYMSDFRLIKGTAIYDKSFTPPTGAL